MVKALKVAMAGLFVVTCIFFAGCTAQVRPTVSKSEYLSDKAKIPATVSIYLSDGFRTYAPKHSDPADMKNWVLNIGPMASDAFTYAFESRFEKVVVKAGTPKFPITDGPVDFVVTPAFTSFNSGEPVLVKFENYWVELGMTVTIQDGQGKTLDTLNLKNKGVKQGSIGLESGGIAAYPVACVEAVKPMVDQTVQKVVQLAGTK